MTYLLANLVLLPIAIALVYSMYPNIYAETNFAYLFLFALLFWYILTQVFQIIVDLTRFVRAQWGRYRDVRLARRIEHERALQRQTRVNARRVYAGSETLPGNAATVIYSFLGVPERVTRRGGPPSHTAREIAAHRGSLNRRNAE